MGCYGGFSVGDVLGAVDPVDAGVGTRVGMGVDAGVGTGVGAGVELAFDRHVGDMIGAAPPATCGPRSEAAASVTRTATTGLAIDSAIQPHLAVEGMITTGVSP